MDRDEERELQAVISEEKAKIVIGDGYFSAPFDQWVDDLRDFVQTQRCGDCSAPFDIDEPEEEIWGWTVEGSNEFEELEVVQFICSACLDLPDELREVNHPQTWGVLIFRREPTGTFPLDDED